MNRIIRGAVVIWSAPTLLAITGAVGLAGPRTPDLMPPAHKSTTSPQRWSKVSVDLPVSETSFPAGAGADLATSQCLICHSAGMVLRQPPLTLDQWVGEIKKMRSAFGAPLPADQIDAVAKYLYSINGLQSRSDPKSVDGQGS